MPLPTHFKHSDADQCARSLSFHTRTAAALAFAIGAAVLGGCSQDVVLPQDLAPTDDHGPRVRWEPGARPFPEIPLPNDFAARIDDTSPTGLRLNASMVAPTFFERTARVALDRLDGWGTTMPISVPFEGDLDLADISRRHPLDPSDFTDDAVYLVDLVTGVPVPLDLGSGHYPLSIRNRSRPLAMDPRAGGTNLLLSSIDEDTNHDGVLQLSEDSNFDGILQRPSPLDFGLQTAGHWEAETHSLIVRPLLPLLERHAYAVVLTSRLHAASGVIRSPFDTIAHPDQLTALRRLEEHLANPALQQRFYGDLRWSRPVNAGAPGTHVVFAWKYTTQTTVTDMLDVAKGINGEGRLRNLASVAPNFRLGRAHPNNIDACPNSPTPYVVTRAELTQLATSLLPVLGFQGAQAQALVDSFQWVDYATVATVDSPYLIRNTIVNDPDSAMWDLDAVAQNQQLHADKVQMWIFVPRRTAQFAPPFKVALYPHGYGLGAYQSILFAGYFARMGLATITANAPTHGFALNAMQLSTARTLFRGMCLGPFADVALAGRARDVNEDGQLDSGAEFLTANIFRTRDMIRQTTLDYLQIIRAMRAPSWSQPGPDDHNGDGRPDAPGDFNGDGTVDLVGPNAAGQQEAITLWGESLGSITAGVLGAVEPAIEATVGVSGAGGLTDVTTRSMIGAVQGAVMMPAMGPVIAAMPASDRPPVSARRATACAGDQTSLRMIVQDATDVGELEFSCRSDLRPGDDVLVLNGSSLQQRCARVDSNGRLFLPVAADKTDPLALVIFQGQAMVDYGRCQIRVGAQVRAEITTFQVFDGDCEISCGYVPPDAAMNSPARMQAIRRRPAPTPLFAPTAGLGLKRQTAAFRRFIHLAQTGIDAGDPVNFAPLFSERPLNGRRRPLLWMTTAGDDIVPVSAGITYARAAGLVPFMSTSQDPAFESFLMPASRAMQYEGRSSEALLVQNFVAEGIPELERFMTPNGSRLLFDIDNLDGNSQGFGEPNLTPALRMVRVLQSDRNVEDSAQTRWMPRRGDLMSAYLTAYIVPNGTHVFGPSDPTLRWDVNQYLTNLVIRYLSTAGRDLPYATDPAHFCLTDSSCSWLPRMP
jgi:hypothetical protein